MFLDNKYTIKYHKIIQRAQLRNIQPEERLYKHHIIPRCMGGGNEKSNLVKLTYKEHRVVHCLLVKMVTGHYKIKLNYAYRFFRSNCKMVEGCYKYGKDNNFAQPKVIEIVKNRMINNNPMSLEVSTPLGVFKSASAAARAHNIPVARLYKFMSTYDGYEFLQESDMKVDPYKKGPRSTGYKLISPDSVEYICKYGTVEKQCKELGLSYAVLRECFRKQLPPPKRGKSKGWRLIEITL